MKMKLALKAALASAMCAMFGGTVSADASSIMVDSVAQRWPWNNKLDITYTVSGGQNVSAGVYAKIVFTATIDGKEYAIDGMSDVSANASDGTHTVAYELPAGLKAKNCTMTAKLIASEVPSGDDYMIVDLATGRIAWEGLMISQDASNARYNTDLYKTDKLVLRKVPAGINYAKGKSWAMSHVYYAGVFPVTSAQYAKVCGGSGDTKPKASVSWYGLRGSNLTPADNVPASGPNTGTFLQRLNYLSKRYFDLPTEMMMEICMRAGTTTTYSWGGEMNTDYIVCKANSGGGKVAVGSRLPNTIGLYDTSGNVWEICLDDNDGEGGRDGTDPFVPKVRKDGNVSAVIIRGGGSYGDSHTDNWLWFTPDWKGLLSQTPSATAPWTGFRVFHIVK